MAMPPATSAVLPNIPAMMKARVALWKTFAAMPVGLIVYLLWLWEVDTVLGQTQP
jgi:hypothetical protein